MSQQLNLIPDLYTDTLADEPAPAKIGPYETRRIANEFVENMKPGKRKQVYDYLVSCGDQGATDEEMQTALGMNPNTQRPRRQDLQKADAICESGRTRPTRSDVPAVVWVVVGRE